MSQEPYEISTPDDLAWIAENMDKSLNRFYRLTADITAPDNLVIGTNKKGFSGVFNGGGHYITVHIKKPRASGVGLFAWVERAGKVENLTVFGSAEGESNVGGIAGRNDGEISHCTVSMEVSGKTVAIGAVVGYNSGWVEFCQASPGTLVWGDTKKTACYIGGIAGDNDGGRIVNCVSFASVTGNTTVGGIAGCNNPHSFIIGCRFEGSVSGEQETGRVAGEDYGKTVDCY
jgi:hypothetical protein